MQTRINLTGALVIAACLATLALLILHGPVADPHVAKVLAARHDAYIRSQTRDGKRYFPTVFARQIQQIDASGCPPEFSAAWADYRQAWANFGAQAKKRANADLLELAIATVELSAGHPLAAAKTGAKIVQPPLRPDTQKAWESVKSCAVIFNCQIPANTPDF